MDVCTKTCKTCLLSKSKEDFYFHDGSCKKCTNIKRNARRDPDKRKAYRKQYAEKNREKILVKQTKYILENKTRLTAYDKEYRKKRKDYLNSKRKERIDKRPELLLKRRIRARLGKFLRQKRITKTTTFNEYIGCSPEILRTHIEKQFVSGMSWENRNLWHVDHIIPLSSAKTEEEIYKLCHYTNLQPLWAVDNMKKGSKCPSQ